jgi:hypothetical protein
MELTGKSTVTKKSPEILLPKSLKFVHESGDSAHDNGEGGGDSVCSSGG